MPKIVITVPDRLVRSVEATLEAMRSSERWAGLSLSRSDVYRVALFRGVAALGKEMEAATTTKATTETTATTEAKTGLRD